MGGLLALIAVVAAVGCVFLCLGGATNQWGDTDGYK
jgi:hypothetical protein